MKGQPHASAREYSGDCYYHPVPSTEIAELRTTGKTVVILGAGPGGLIAALTLKEEGYDNVIVLEKRVSFSRMNIINLHPESQHVLKRLNILDRFIERASLIADHRNHVFSDGEEIYSFHDLAEELDINPDQPFDAEDVLAGFKNETLYSISIADLQDLLATVAVERGIKVQGGVEARLIPDNNCTYSIQAAIDSNRSIAINAPTLIILAEGSNSSTFKALGGSYLRKESLWPNESWVFGHYQCDPEFGFCHLLFEFSKNHQDLTISNCIFLPPRNEVNIAVTVKNPDLPGWRIKEIIEEQAAKILDASGVTSRKNQVVWHSNKAVRILGKTAERCHFGTNLILTGDAVGTNSPVAAFGGTLCTSAYSYALRELVHDLDSESHHPELALAHYGYRVRSYAARWHYRVDEIRQKVLLDIRAETEQLAGTRSARDNNRSLSGVS